MHLPPFPGVYVVELLNEHPISVNADRPSIAERCISVTKANCKYGRAKNLARRQRDYIRTFGSQHVRFCYFAVTDHYMAVEAKVAADLASYRMSGATGRLNEWLQGISANEVKHVVRAAVESHSEREPTSSKVRKSKATSLPSSTLMSTSPGQIVDAAVYLERQGMSVSALRDLHHSSRRRETFRSTLRYFGKKTSSIGRNLIYGSRLIYLADAHRRTGKPFLELVQQALSRYPDES